jgi:hypothetical protein
VRTGDYASRNVFERKAGLADGGYTEHPLRSVQRAQRRAQLQVARNQAARGQVSRTGSADQDRRSGSA